MAMPKRRRGGARTRQTGEQRVWGLPQGVKLRQTLRGHEGWIGRIAWSPDGRIIASPSADKTIRLWDVETGAVVGTLDGHSAQVSCVAWSPDGQWLASAGFDHTVRLWKSESGRLIQTLKGHTDDVCTVAWSPDGHRLASGSRDRTIRLWDPKSGQTAHVLQEHMGLLAPIRVMPGLQWEAQLLLQGIDHVMSIEVASDGRILSGVRPILAGPGSPGEAYLRQQGINHVMSIAWSPDGRILSGSEYDVANLWNVDTGQLVHTLRGHIAELNSLAWLSHQHAPLLVTSSDDKTIRLWEITTGKSARIIEGHTDRVLCVAIMSDQRLMASKGGYEDNTIRLWRSDTWGQVTVIPELSSRYSPPGLAFHPSLPLLASVGSDPDAPPEKRDTLIHIWELDLAVLLGTTPQARATPVAVQHATAKIVLVGDSGVGKTGLGWRLAHGEFKEHASTHGQQFWVLKELSTRRADGTECEAILWDLAGQPDYRLTHALFLDDADLVLVLFDPTDSHDPLHGVEFWLKQLKAGQTSSTSGQQTQSGDKQAACSAILIGARADRGAARLTQDELDAFCRQRGISGGYLATSAKENMGLEELLRRMKDSIPWDQKTTTVTTVTFKRIKDYALVLKENRRRRKVIVSPQDLRQRLVRTDKTWQFTDAEMMTAVGHLANYGYMRVLRTSKGEERILLVPELLNNLAASFVLEARRNQKGLGALEEKRLLAGEYPFRELEKLVPEEREVLLDAAALLFLEHNICFRETDPLGGQSYLVFPELINLKKPVLENEQPTEDGVAYTVSGAVENVYASLVVLLGYTQTFTRTDQWRSQARYEVGDGLICGFLQDAEREGELDLVLYFGTNVGRPVRTLFQGLFESFLARRNLSVFRYEPVVCANGHALNRAVVREQLRKGSTFAFCSECGEKLTLPKADEPIQLTQTQRHQVDEQQWFAARRSRFEQAVFQVVSYVESQNLQRPECFISYAWGNKEQERWVERNLATDLQKAGIGIVLDRWENARTGASVARFVERIEQCDRVIVVGTPLYRKKYNNKDTSTGYVVAAEVDVISNRLLGTEAQKETVLPLLLAGQKTSSLPPLLHGRVFADFRDECAYFTMAFDLILDLYGISHGNPAVADLRESLQDSELR